jgi:cinnamoyl-CoA:phenyllactate CoA-transferase
MRKRPAVEWLKVFKEEGVPVQPCATFEDIVVDEQAWESKVLFKAETIGGHEHIYVNIPVRLGCVGDPKERMRMSQPVGTDTRQVLRESGYSDNEIDDMALKRAIRVRD